MVKKTHTHTLHADARGLGQAIGALRPPNQQANHGREDQGGGVELEPREVVADLGAWTKTARRVQGGQQKEDGWVQERAGRKKKSTPSTMVHAAHEES